MAAHHHHNPWVLVFGLLGNIVSFIVFLAPLPTFYRIIKKRNTEGFQSTPYVASLFSAMLWILYAVISNEMLLLTINIFGCFIETVYLVIYIIFASKQARIFTLRFLFLLNFGGFCFILLLSHFIAKGENRIRILGGISVGFTVTVFVAPLSIMKVVIQTKSVEFMPFSLSLFLTMNAVMWLLYGIALGDFFVALPNVLGFTFGVAQMILYAMYMNYKPKKGNEKLPEHKADVAMTSPPPATANYNSEAPHSAPADHSLESATTTVNVVDLNVHRDHDQNQPSYGQSACGHDLKNYNDKNVEPYAAYQAAALAPLVNCEV